MSRSQHRPWFLATALAVLFPVILLAAVSQTAAEDVFRSKDHSYRAVTLAQGLDQPWGMAFLPRAQGILITEKSGRIRLYRGRLLPGVVRGGPKSVESGQGGLMDIALHPQFDDNGLVYFTYTGRGIGGVGTELARARFTGRDLKDLEVLFRADPKTRGGRHFGSRLVFDREGYLFMTYGDRGGRHDAQDLGVHQGGIFRFTADGEVPADNPFVNQPGARPEFYSYGHRNAQGATLHPETGVLWAHEHGPQGGDEVNVIRKGANYGWPKITYGEEYGGGKVSEHTALPGMEQPLLYWVPSIAPSGMAFYTGDKFPQWKGDLFVGALRGTHLRRVRLDGETVLGQEELLEELGERIRDVRNGPDGYLYVLTDSGDGRLTRLEPVDGK